MECCDEWLWWRTPYKQVQQWNAQAKFTIYDNLHNLDLEKVVDLKSAKENWERLQALHEGESNTNGREKEEEEKGPLKGKWSTKWHFLSQHQSGIFSRREREARYQTQLSSTLAEIEKLSTKIEI